jgi:hypothetical protein
MWGRIWGLVPKQEDSGESQPQLGIREALLPLVRMAEALSCCIQGYDEKIEKLGREKYGHTALLRQVKGVGPITSLAYVLTLGNPDRFVKSRRRGLVKIGGSRRDPAPRLCPLRCRFTLLLRIVMLLQGRSPYPL